MNLNNPDLFKQQCYIAGQWIDSPTHQVTEVLNPLDDSIIGYVPNLGKKEAKQAIKAAHTAFKLWKQTTAETRAQLLRRWHVV